MSSVSAVPPGLEACIEKYRPQLLVESHFNLYSLYATAKINTAPHDLRLPFTKNVIRSDVDIALSIAYKIDLL